MAVDVARRTGWSPTKVCRLETGLGAYSEVAVATYLAHCGVPANEVAEIFHAFDSRGEGYLARRDIMRNLVLHETTASRILVNAPSLVPGLLQTEDYARAVASIGNDLPPDEVERRVKVRMDRQGLLRQWNRPEMRYLISESVLRTPLGSRQLMHEQLLHLVFAADRPSVEIHVVRQDACGTAAVIGYFTLMDFPDHASVLFVEGGLGSMLIEDPSALAEARLAEQMILDDALDVRESREFLARVASEYD